jgi:hypothetical protein
MVKGADRSVRGLDISVKFSHRCGLLTAPFDRSHSTQKFDVTGEWPLLQALVSIKQCFCVYEVVLFLRVEIDY